MNLPLGLLIAYVLIAVLLLLALRSAQLPAWIKLSLVTIVSVFYFVTWLGLRQLLGFPSPEPLPADFRLVWVHVEEPQSPDSDDGGIYYWLRPLDNAGIPLGPPRAHVRPFSIPEAIAAEAAAARLKEGELLNGRQSRSALTARDNNESQDSAGERSTDDPDDSAALFFEFFEVAPPTLPEKDIPIR
jgi:hypothetical protein